MTDAPALLPCDCGFMPTVSDVYEDGWLRAISCANCDVCVQGKRDPVTDLWNRRAAPPASVVPAPEGWDHARGVMFDASERRRIEGERDAARAEANQLRSYITGALPFLEEAWTACFHGHEAQLLSAEERGMGMLLGQFRELAEGERVLPPDCVTVAQANKQREDAIAWAYRLLGSPNELRPELREWIRLGETCADGIERANAEVTKLREALEQVAAVDVDHGFHARDLARAALAAVPEQPRT